MATSRNTTKSNKGKYVLIGLGVVAIAGTAFYFITRKPKQNFISDDITKSFEEDAKVSTASSAGSSSGFPLRKGSRGDLVKTIQETLIQKYGAGILPKWGADGIWGTELETALLSKGFPTSIDADNFTKIMTGTGLSTSTSTTTDKPTFNPDLLASNLRLAIIDDDLNKAITSLTKIFNVKGYTAVNDYFKEKRIDGVRKTLVNALLTKFSDESQKKRLNEQFYRMGLKYNGSQWSLSGLSQILCDQIKSTSNTKVWDASGKTIIVPRETILGQFMGGKNGITKFKTLDDKTLYTNTKCICYV